MKARRGMRGFADIARALLRQPATAIEVAERHGFSPQTARWIMKGLNKLRVFRVCEWRLRQGTFSPVYAFEIGDDAPRPHNVVNGLPSRHRSVTCGVRPGVEMIAFASVVECLRAERSSLDDLVDYTGIRIGALRRLVKHMKSIGLVHYATWRRRPTGVPEPVYGLRPGKDSPSDAVRPKPFAKAVLSRLHRQRVAAGLAPRGYVPSIAQLAANASVFTMAQGAR